MANAAGGDGADVGAFETQNLMLINVARTEADIVVTFKAIGGNTFRLERKPALPGAPWESIAGLADLKATSTGPADVTHVNGVAGSRAFYRVALVR